MDVKSPPFLIIVFISASVILTTIGPAEATLGSNVRVVYLHGAWVWVSLAAFVSAGVVGLVGFIRFLTGAQALNLHEWSRALGRTGIFYWITYLPISLWAMETNWNGLFLAEPRWRVAVIFSISGILLQLGLSFLPALWASIWNPAYTTTLLIVLGTTDNVMHPPSPILDSSAWRIQVFFGGLTLLVFLTAWQVARWFHSLEKSNCR